MSLLSTDTLGFKAYRLIADFMMRESGIHLNDAKHQLVEGRLRKRLRLLEIDTFKEYLAYVFEHPDGQIEQLCLIDALTTNKTDFFRENEHFEFLAHRCLPDRAEGLKSKRNPLFRAWSAGCSSGEEPYTLAMVLDQFKRKDENFNFSVLASDISPTMLRHAERAVYSHELVRDVPIAYRKAYLLRRKSQAADLIKINAQIRKVVQFRSINLTRHAFTFSNRFDVIFCRNVMIYFDQTDREALIDKFVAQLNPGGYLFIGHSERIEPEKHGLMAVIPTVYRVLL